MSKILQSISLGFVFSTSLVNALPNSPGLASDSHTTRKIIVEDTSQKNWQIEFTGITEQSLLHFTTENGMPIETNSFFPITSNFTYGFFFDASADFDIVYAVTAISYDGNAMKNGNPKCVFLFTALGPAVPENYVNNFADAKCRLERDSSDMLNLVLAK